MDWASVWWEPSSLCAAPWGWWVISSRGGDPFLAAGTPDSHENKQTACFHLSWVHSFLSPDEMASDPDWASINFPLSQFHPRLDFALGLSWDSSASSLLGSSLSPLQLKVYSRAAQACPKFRASRRKGSSSCSSQPARETPLAGLRRACYYKFTPTSNSGQSKILHGVHISSY